jgi:DNA-binding HxlR family transcriptional regulator
MPPSYHQSCPAARTLEIVGERWTLLIIRDLVPGPRRFGELQQSLAGAAPNLLSDRLKRLEAAGVITRSDDPRPRYALSEAGRELVPVVAGLFTWGAKHLGADVALRHRACGTAVEVHIWCPACAKTVPRSDCDRVALDPAG